MAPLDIDTALEWRGRTVLDREGDKIGTLDELYLDESDRPAWGAVTTGLFGRRQSFVPLADLRPAGEDLQVPYEKSRVKDAPSVDPDERLSGEDEDALHRHYGIADDAPRANDVPEGQSRVARGEDDADEAAGEPGAEAPRRADGGDAGAEMIRSEEEVDVGTRRRMSGRARLKKYVVTEHVKKVVPVQREQVRVEFDPADEEDAGDEAVRDEAVQDDAGRDEPVRDDAAAQRAAEEHPRRG